jgi:thymidylate synthase
MGLPYDVMRHSMLMAVIAQTLGVELGHMQITLAHPHLYEQHFDFAQEMLVRTAVVPSLGFAANWTVVDVEKNPDDYVLGYKQAAQYLDWPTYAPKTTVVR